MTRTWPIRDALDWKTQLGLSAGFAFVLGLSLVLPINDCVIGRFGDVSDVLRTTWPLTTGSATLVSFVLAVRKYRAETSERTRVDESTDSPTAIHVEGVEGDVDLSVTLSDVQSEHLDEPNVSRPPKDGDSDSSELDYEDTDEVDHCSNDTDSDSNDTGEEDDTGKESAK